VFNDKETWDNEELLKQITIEPDKLYHEFSTHSMKEYTKLVKILKYIIKKNKL
jgi:hypothetical protein